VGAALTVLGVVLAVAWFLLVWWMFANRAAGPGMRLMKLQLVGLSNGKPIGWSRFLGRTLFLALLTSTGIGLLLMLVFLVQHPRKQGWHDLLAGSVVIKERVLAPARKRAPAAQQQSAPSVQATPPVLNPAAPAGAGGQTRPAAETAPPPPLTPPTPVPAVDQPAVRSTMVTDDSVRLRPRSEVAVAPVEQAAAPGHDVEAPAPEVEATVREAGRPLQSMDERPLDEGWVAVLDDGREMGITGLLLLGRNPQARPGEEDAELVKVADESRTVSKTHLSLSVDANGLYVMDRGSTNGSTLTDVVGVSKPCLAGAVVPLSEGGIVSFGDHWLRIERRS
jgi:hypothetical protein